MLAIWAIDPLEESITNDFVTVYATDGEIIGNFNYVNSINWSPEPPYRILFSEYNDYETTPPCILDVLNNTHACFDKVSQWRQEKDAGITGYQWSPDGQNISFIFWNMGETYGGGLCVYELNSENISCPVMPGDLQLEGFLYLFVRDYYWSPDGQNIAFYINPNPPLSDDSGFQSIAVVDREGGNLIIIGPSYGFWDPWRP
jgi:Tol biopolymer transport system component